MDASVIIPVYNREFELRRAISSVLHQTTQNFEILVIDDFSEIDINSIVKSYNDDRIKYFRSNNKGNANICRNIGVKEARGRYIAMLDSDDEWLPNHLESKINDIESKNADGVFGSYQIDDGKEIKQIISRDFYNNENMADYLMYGGRAATPTHVYKAKCAKKIVWDENLFRHQDYDYSIRFSELFKFVPSKDITCVVHWARGENRAEHFESQILFINKHKHKISNQNYNKYHFNVYRVIKNRKDIDLSIIGYYEKEQVRFVHALSLNEYLSFMNSGNNRFKRILLRIIYIIRVLFKI